MARFGMILDPLGNVSIHSGGYFRDRRVRRRRREKHQRKHRQSGDVSIGLQRGREHGSAESTI